jgi:hypothetical protein
VYLDLHNIQKLNQGEKNMKKLVVLFLGIFMVVSLVGCGGGGGGGKDDDGNPPPAEVQSVLNDFTNNISNPEEAVKSLSFPFTYTDFNGKQIPIGDSNAGKNTIDGLDISQITLLNSQWKSTGADTGEVTMTARATGDPNETSDYVFILNMQKISEVWKITSLAPKSVSGTLIPDEIDEVLENVGYLIASPDITKVSDYFSLPVTLNGTTADANAVLAKFKDWASPIDTKNKNCQLTVGDKGTFSFTLFNSTKEAQIKTDMIFESGKWKFKNLTISGI